MIKGKHIQLRVIEKTDLNTLRQWWNDPNLRGSEGISFPLTEPQMEKKYKEWLKEKNVFRLLIEKNDQSGLLGKIILYQRYGGIGIITPMQDSQSKQGIIEALELGLQYLFMEESNHNCVSIWIPSWNIWVAYRTRR